ncbi:MAG: valine--tRNA ligase [Thermoplasmata archaeon]
MSDPATSPAHPAPGLPARFDPRLVESRWQQAWAEAGAFRAPDQPRGRPFSLVLPPPNVTGALTMGHMLGDTVMDVLVRRARMAGRPTLWVPGLDHAGLATQVEVRRRLAKQGIRFEELPRAEAVRQVGLWKEEHERRIREQAVAGGFSLDWSRYRYTKDAAAARATREAFVRLYREGLIYRGERMVNWDPRLETAISDLEVVHTEEDGTLYYVRYPWADGRPGGIEIATVRPETILGDVAIAVHPDDGRYRDAVGRSVCVPLTGRIAPVITDIAIDPAFGTGALKVTPRHDLVDYEIFRRHSDLPMPEEIFDRRARLSGSAVPEELRGLDRDLAREKVVERLEREGLLLRREGYRHSVARSERSESVIEPRLSTQWFVRMDLLAQAAVAAVRDGKVRIHPERWDLTFFRWMEGIQDWCISRQVLWGHPIPVYRCSKCDHEFATVDEPTKCPKCSGGPLDADPDVLDTWFTSWMWPFAALGWPERTGDLDHYYPTTILVTGRDIMFFWVARMMMAGLHFTGQPPFSDVVFTGMLRDAQGRRMSKHLGNSPDPITVIGERGADAMRFGLLFPNPTEDDGPFGAATLDGSRNFLTKVWNVGRFTILHTPPGTDAPSTPPVLGVEAPLEDRWILSRYARTLAEVESALDAFEVSRAATALYQFVWHDLADRYVEIVKERLAGGAGTPSQRAARSVLLFTVERSLRLLHPFVPHVTEELWHALPHDGDLLALSHWPGDEPVPRDDAAEGAMSSVLEAVRWLRNLRAEEAIPAEQVPTAWLRATSNEARSLFERERATVERLARVRPFTLLADGAAAPPGAASRVAPFGEVSLLRPAGSGDESSALEKEREKLVALLEKSRERLADPSFRARAPAKVAEELGAKVDELTTRIQRIDAHLKGGSSPSENP